MAITENVVIDREIYEVLVANYRNHVALHQAFVTQAPILTAEQLNSLPRVED